MGSLKLAKASDLASELHYNVMLYGENGSGKTHFAGTWPSPIFLVPYIARGEMRTWADTDIPVIFFESMADLAEQLNLLEKAMSRKNVTCKTVVLDNLTTTQLVFEAEIKESENVEKLEYSHWARFTGFFVALMKKVKSWPVHSIWICHSDAEKTLSLKGDAKHFFPDNADLMLYCENKDLGTKGLEYVIHGRKYGRWPARMRLPKYHENTATFGRISSAIDTKDGKIHPHYDDFAQILGLKSCAEVEGRNQ